MKEKEAKTKFQPLQVTRSPVACSPQKNLTGSIRIARDIAADLYNTIQRWNTLHISGAQFVKMIAVEKAVDPKKYSPALEELTTNLYEVVQNLKSIEGQFRIFKTQIRALEKVDKNSETFFLSLNLEGIANLIETIVDAYLEEFKVKELVLENIAHSRTKDEVMFFAACWTLQAHISSGINLKLETLLLDTGHRKELLKEMNDTQQKPFACTVKGCEMTFTNKDHLECHQKKHDMMLNLGLVNKNNDSADQTPTPTRFIRNCEEVGLFQDLQNVNPFDEIFKKATDIVKSGGTLDVAEANNSDDTLHTPHILPHIEGSKGKTAICQTKQDATHRSCDFTLVGIYSDSTPENSLKSPEKDNNLTETVKDKIIKTLQNKEKLKNDKAVLASRFVSVVPFRDLTAEKRSDVINIDSGSENKSSTNETKEKIREMNRAAQTRCRKRKQIRLRQMEEEICSLREENKRLKVENELLKCQLLKDLGKNTKDVAPVPSRIIKQPDSQKQKKIAPSVSPALPIIIHIGPNITSPTIPVITKSPEPSSGKVNGQATTKDDRITKSAIVKKKFFRKIIPKILIDKC